VGDLDFDRGLGERAPAVPAGRLGRL